MIVWFEVVPTWMWGHPYLVSALLTGEAIIAVLTVMFARHSGR